MDMAAELSRVRSDVQGCHLIAFIDLSARMVLVYDARSKPPQERLDGLADRSQRLLTTPDVADPMPDHAMVITEDNLEIYLRGAPTTEDSLALVCSLRTDAQSAIDTGFALLKGLDHDA